MYARTINEHYALCPDRHGVTSGTRALCPMSQTRRVWIPIALCPGRRSVWTGRRPNHWSRTGCAGKHALASFFILNQHYVTTAHAGLVSLPGIETTTAR